MGRAGVYKSDVEKARRALLAQGKNPSVDQVRVQLGNTGSRSTIHRFLKEIEAEATAPPGTKPAVSDALQDLVARLAERLHEEANAQIEAHRSASEAQVREHAAIAQAARQEAAGLRESLQRTETMLAAERTSHKDTAAQLQAAKVLVAQLEERAAGQERLGREQEARLQSLEEKHLHARDALEHFRTQALEQRAREQRQHEQALQALQVELRQAADQVTAKNAELLQLNRDNGRLLEQSTHLQQALAAAEREQQQTRGELEALRPLPAQLTALERRAAQAIAQAEGLQSRLAQADERLEQLRTKLQDVELDRARTAAKLEGMQAALGAREPAVAPAAADTEPAKRKARGPRETSTTGDLLE
jgi:DNA repair exonuclease SbcCD ATPase subunit